MPPWALAPLLRTTGVQVSMAAMGEPRQNSYAEHAALGNIQPTILHLLAEGEQVAMHWRVAPTHYGGYLGVAAAGKPVT